MTNKNSSFYCGQRKWGTIPNWMPSLQFRRSPIFFEIFFFFFQVFQVNPTFLPITSTLFPKHKFEIIITNPRNDFYTLLQNLNKNEQKRTRKINFGYKRWTLSQETSANSSKMDQKHTQ